MPAAAWLEATDIPDKPSTPDLEAFFGVPPDPKEKIDSNIERKRRHWRSKTRARVSSEKAQKKVEQALRIIDALAQLLKRGVVDEDIDFERLREDFAGAPETEVGEIGDLWRILEELLAAGKTDEALRVANEARKRFKDEARAHAGFAFIAYVSMMSRSATPGVLKEGVEAAAEAVAKGQADLDIFLWKGALEVASGNPAEALNTLARGEQKIGAQQPWLFAHRCEANGLLGNITEAIGDAKNAVKDGTADPTLRGFTADALVRTAVVSLLPIPSAEGLQKYQQVVEWAAWCAAGVPEAEDQVRPFRMWGVEAESRAYAGRLDVRAILATATGFLALPAMNRTRSKPHWQVVRDGPEAVKDRSMFNIVAYGPLALEVHAPVTGKLEWWAADEANRREWLSS